MRAVRVHEYKKPPQVDEVPQPDLTSDDDVIVRVGGAGVCRTDLHVVDGWLEDVMPVEAPFILGHENAGWVEAIGRNVTNVAVGDPAIVHPLRTCGICWGCRLGEDMYCSASSFPGVNADGGYAEYMRASARSVLALPESVNPVDVAPLADAGITVYRAVRKAVPFLRPGTTVVVMGVGGLGHIGIQLLQTMTAAQVIAVDPSQTGQQLARELGTDVVLGDHPVEGIMEATKGLGADVVLDFVGENGTPGVAIEIVRQGGMYVVVGYGGKLDIPTMALVLKEVRIEGSLVGNHADFSELMDLVGAGSVRLHTQIYALEDAPKALDDLAAGGVKGRAVLTPNAA